MIDLSKYESNKDSYISRVEINEDFTKFRVFYASGIVEECDFSIHNYQVYIYRMEEQYNRYKEYYLRDIHCEYRESVKKAILKILLNVGLIVLASNLDLGILFDIVYKVLIIMNGAFDLLAIKQARRKLDDQIMKLGINEVYLCHKEDFAIDVVDPRNNNSEKWYIVDLNHLEEYESVFELSMTALPLKIPEIREEYSTSLTKVLKKGVNTD